MLNTLARNKLKIFSTIITPSVMTNRTSNWLFCTSCSCTSPWWQIGDMTGRVCRHQAWNLCSDIHRHPALLHGMVPIPLQTIATTDLPRQEWRVKMRINLPAPGLRKIHYDQIWNDGYPLSLNLILRQLLLQYEFCFSSYTMLLCSEWWHISGGHARICHERHQ